MKLRVILWVAIIRLLCDNLLNRFQKELDFMSTVSWLVNIKSIPVWETDYKCNGKFRFNLLSASCYWKENWGWKGKGLYQKRFSQIEKMRNFNMSLNISAFLDSSLWPIFFPCPLFLSLFHFVCFFNVYYHVLHFQLGLYWNLYLFYCFQVKKTNNI